MSNQLIGIVAAALVAISAVSAGKPSDGSLSIAKQGIFSAGGITVTSDGTFDPEN